MENTIKLELNQIGQVEKEVASISEAGRLIKVTNNNENMAAGAFLKSVKDKMRELEERRKLITAPLDAAKKSVMDLFRKPQEALESIERFVKNLMITFDTEQRRLQAEQQRKLDEQARREEEKKRKALNERADKAAANGNEEKAEGLRQQAAEVQVQAPVIAPMAEKVPGVTFKEEWDFAIVDENAVPREYMVIDEKKIRQVVKAMKSKTNIPGVKAFARKNIAA